MKKQKCVLVDIHGTLLNADNKLNKELADIISALSNVYPICIYTAGYYFNEHDAKMQLKDIEGADYIFYNQSVKDLDDVRVKKNMYVKHIEPLFDIIGVIDNNKKVCNMFNKDFALNVMRFKDGKK